MPRLHRPLRSYEIAARRRNAQKSTGPRTARGKRRAALNSLKWPLWPARLRAEIAKESVPDPQFRQLTRELIALLEPFDEYSTRLVTYLTSNWWIKAFEVRTIQRHAQGGLDFTRIESALESDLESLAVSLAYRSRKWRYRLEKNLGEPVESFADLRAKIESRLPILQDWKDAPRSEPEGAPDRSGEEG